jgi:hypothetical protein
MLQAIQEYAVELASRTSQLLCELDQVGGLNELVRVITVARAGVDQIRDRRRQN